MGEAAGRVVSSSDPTAHARSFGLRAGVHDAALPYVRDGCALGRHFARGDGRGADRPGAVAMKLRAALRPGVRVAVSRKAVVIEKSGTLGDVPISQRGDSD